MLKKRVTMKDIARRLGISVNSVSHALNDASDISSETKEKVMKTAVELGYKFNMIKRGERSGTLLVAGICESFSDSYCCEILDFLRSELEARGFAFNAVAADKFSKNNLQTFLARGVNGIISLLSPFNLDAVELGVPVVVLGGGNVPTGMDLVEFDNIAAGENAAEYFESLGVQTAVYAYKNRSGAKERCDSVKAAASRRGIKVKEIHADKSASVPSEADAVAVDMALNAVDLRGAKKDVAVFETLGRDIIDRSEAAASAAERLSFYIKTGCIAEKTEPIKLKTIL